MDTDTTVVIGPLRPNDMQYALQAALQDFSAVPNEEMYRHWGPDDVWHETIRITHYYCTTESTEIDIRWVAEGFRGWWYVAAWNDYTGWGCQDGVSIRWSETFDGLVRFGLDAEDRRRWNLPA